LTNKDKFSVKFETSQYCTYRHSEYGPTFGGGHDLNIANKSNENDNSYSLIGHTYSNEKYTYNDYKSF